MKPENEQNPLDDDALQVPPELIRALGRLRGDEANVFPPVDSAILQAAKIRMVSIRKKHHSRISAWRLWSLAAAACVAMAWLVPRATTIPAGTPSLPTVAQDEDASAVILREFSALYPNQVRAIIQDSRGIKLTLADKPDVPPGKALVLKVCESHGCEEIITFSGQNIMVAGHSVTVRTEHGDLVILDGEEFFWSSEANESASSGIYIESRRL